VEKAKGATEVDARNEETYQEEVPEGRPTPGEEMMRMMEEDKYDNDNVRQDWNDTSGTLFYSLRKYWPTCSACDGPCKLMVETTLRFAKEFHGEREYKGAVLQRKGFHYEDKGRDAGTGKPKSVCELRRVTLKENKNNALKTCAQLQSQGNLSGPHANMASRAVVLFYEMASRLGMMGKGDTGKRQSHIRTAIIDSCKECLEEPVAKHEKHLSLFPPKKWFDLRPKSDDSELPAVDEIYRSINCENKLEYTITSGKIRGIGMWDDFKETYGDLLRDHIRECFD